MRRLISIIIGIPLAILVVALAVANRKPVILSFNPFSPDAGALSVTVPLFLVIFITLIIGVLLGGAVAWLSQGRFRREARRARHIVPPPAPKGPALPAPVRRS